MKNIIVFGAAGRTGKYVVQYALEAGHKVTAFVHKDTPGIRHPSLVTIIGDVHEEEKVSNAIKGKEVVISTLGVKQIEGDAVNVMSDAMKIFVEAMNRYKVKRVFGVGGRAVLQYDANTQLLDRPDYPAEFRNVGEGHNKVYKVLRETDLDWTFICCPDIIDGPRTGRYNLKKDYPPEGLFQIYTGDIADFILKEMEENKFLGTRVGICNY